MWKPGASKFDNFDINFLGPWTEMEPGSRKYTGPEWNCDLLLSKLKLTTKFKLGRLLMSWISGPNYEHYIYLISNNSYYYIGLVVYPNALTILNFILEPYKFLILFSFLSQFTKIMYKIFISFPQLTNQ